MGGLREFFLEGNSGGSIFKAKPLTKKGRDFGSMDKNFFGDFANVGLGFALL